MVWFKQKPAKGKYQIPNHQTSRNSNYGRFTSSTAQEFWICKLTASNNSSIVNHFFCILERSKFIENFYDLPSEFSKTNLS